VCFGYGAVTHSGRPFQSRSPTQQLGNSVAGLVPCLFDPTTPRLQRHQALTQSRFGLNPLRSPLLRVSRLLSFPHGTEMFQFPWFPPPVLCVHTGVPLHDEWRVSPFGHLRIEAWSTAPRSFSQSPTSFIGSWRQGIHRWLFVAWKELKDARACSAVLKVRPTPALAELEVSSTQRRHGKSTPAPSKRKRRQARRRNRRERTRSFDLDDP
jgi:hypothetical protein